MTASPASERFARFAPAIAFLVLAIVYFATLSRGLAGGDTPELITAAHTIGIPHEPGYPLYVLVGRVWSYVPLGNGIVTMNALSALAGALAGGVLAALLCEAGLAPLTAVLLALAAGLSRVTWSQAVVAEVYTLGLFLGLLALWLVLRWRNEPGPRWLWLGAYVGGLAIGHQPLVVFLLPGVLLLLVQRLRTRAVPWRAVWPAIVFFALPFTLFSVLPIRSAQRPPVDYAQIHTVADFFYEAFGVASRAELMSEGRSGVAAATRVLGATFFGTMGVLTLPVLVLGVVGFVLLARRDAGRALLFALPIPLILGFAAVYQIHDIENYFILPVWLLVLGAGHALTSLGKRAGIVGAALGLVLVVGAGYANRVVCDRSRYHLVDDFVSNTFACVPPGGALFVLTETQAGPFLCSQLVRGQRRDVKLVDMSGVTYRGDLGFRELRGNWRTERWQHMEALYAQRDPRIGGRAACALMYEAGNASGKPFEYRRRGLVYELVPRGSPPAPQPEWRTFRFRLPPPALVRYERTGFSLAPLIQLIYANAAIAYAEERLGTGHIDEASELYRQVFDFAPGSAAAHAGLALTYSQKGDAANAERELRIVLEADPKSVQALNGLGVILLGQGKPEEAEAFFKRAVEADPDFPLTWLNMGQAMSADPARRTEAITSLERFLELAPGDPDAPRVRALLETLRQGS